MTDQKPPIALITDSTCNIPPERIQQHHIYIVLQHLIWGTEDLLDLKDITAAGFYERLARDPIHPKTSQPPSSDFTVLIDQAIADGAKEAVIMTVSAALSGTNNSAHEAAKVASIPVQVYDSRSVGMGLGWQVLAAANARDSGGDVAAMVKAGEKARDGLAMVLTLDTLDFLHKGGRIGGAQKLIGSALKIKPQLIINTVTGLVEAGERARTRSKGIESMYQVFFKRMQTNKPMRIAVHHAAALKEAEEVMERIRREHNPTELFIIELTPVLGVHGGPGTLAIGGYYEQ